MFKKSKKNFALRIRKIESDDEDENEDKKNFKDSKNLEDITERKIEDSFKKKDSKKDNSKNKEITSKISNLLSFNDDEDDNDDIFIVKKSNQSRRMNRRKKMIEIKIDDHEKKPEIKIGKSTKDNIEPITETISLESDDDDNEEVPQFLFRSKALNDVKSALNKGLIPDSKVISMLKEQRQKMSTKEYITLAHDNEDDEEEVLKETRRMKLNQDFDYSDGSDIEDEINQAKDKRIHLGKVDYLDSDKNKARQIFEESQQNLDFRIKNNDDDDVKLFSDFRNKIYQDKNLNNDNEDDDDEEEEEEEDDDDSENETDRWEREQMEKAMKLKTIKHIEKDHHNLSKLFSKHSSTKYIKEDKKNYKKTDNQKSEYNYNKDISTRVISNETKNSDKISSLPSHITKNRKKLDFYDLNNRRSAIRNQIAQELEDNRRTLERTKLDFEITTRSLSDFEERKDVLVKEYNLYKKTKEFLSNLCNCINDKYAEFKRIDEKVYEIYSEAAKKQIEERKLLANDYHTTTATLFMNRQIWNQQNAHYPGATIFDFYDFDGDAEKKNRIWINEQLKMFTFTEELYLEQKSRELLKNYIKELKNLFKDTDQEYSSIDGVLNGFKEWRIQHPDTYLEAFTGEFVAKLLEFHFGISNVFCIFLDKDIEFETDFFKIPNIDKLLKFTEPNMDPLIVPHLLDVIILKKLYRYLEFWNPFSILQSQRISGLLKSIIKYVPVLLDISKLFPEILQKIFLKFEETFNTQMMMPMIDQNRPEIDASCYEKAVYKFASGHFKRQTRRILDIWKNILSFEGLVNDEILVELVRDKLARRHAFVTLSHKSIENQLLAEYLQEFFATIPTTWIENGSAKTWFEPWIAIMIKNRCQGEDNPAHQCLKMFQKKLSI